MRREDGGAISKQARWALAGQEHTLHQITNVVVRRDQGAWQGSGEAMWWRVAIRRIGGGRGDSTG